MQKQQSAEIKDFESLLADFRAAQNAAIYDLKKHADEEIFDLNSRFDHVNHLVQQLKTMIRNQNHHFTEISKA